MAPQTALTSSSRASSGQRSWATSLTILAAITVLLSALVYYLDSHLEDFYIFTPPQLHDLSLRAIGAHGNDTRAVVAYIVGELSDKLPGGYVNLDEEWIFNNAGGAMGAMYIIHASKLPPSQRKLGERRASRSPSNTA
jgi:C-8 sterol isomerase